MRFLIAFCLFAVACHTAYGSANEYLQKYKDQLQKYQPGIHPIKCVLFQDKYVKFYLYTKQTPYPIELSPENPEYLKKSSFDISRSVEMIVHDWMLNVTQTQELVSAFLRHARRPVNVIQVDYSAYSNCEWEDFVSPKIYRSIGIRISKMLQQLREYGISSNMMHVVGYGVGAHIAGAASRQMKPFTVGRITGLDPLGLYFDENRSLEQLNKDDAEFVDVIYTSMGQVGTNIERGNANFYPHRGYGQLLQEDGGDREILKNHVMAAYYFVESVIRGKVFKAYMSDSWESYSSGTYDHDKYSYMGEAADNTLYGKLYLRVKDYPPYGLEKDLEFEQYAMKMDYDVFTQSYLGLANRLWLQQTEKLRSQYPSQTMQFDKQYGISASDL